MISERETIEEIKFGSDVNNVVLAEELVDRVCASQEVDEDAYGNVLIAVTEAVNNAIIHGNKLDENLVVNIIVERNDKSILFCVKDQGSGFDFNNLEDPTDPKNIEKPHGRGIFLMKNLADTIEYMNCGNEVVLEFTL